MTNYKKHIPILKNESWWGGNVEDGIQMPYHVSFKRNLYGDLLYNQGSPLLVSNRGRFLWSETPFTFFVDSAFLHVEGSSELIFDEESENLKEAYKKASHFHFPTANKMPDETFFSKPQFNTWMEMTHEPSQEKVLKFAKDILARGFPPGILMIDDGWQENFGAWNFHPGRFPNPKEMIKELKELGFTVMLWLCPFVSPDSITFRMLDEAGYLIRNKENEPVIRKWWNGYSGLLDLSNDEASKWMKDKMDKLINGYGIDGFKMDGGDPQYYFESDVCSKELTPNDHSLEWAKIGLEYPYNEYRACWKLGGQPLVQRLSDKSHSWDALNSLIPNALAQGLIGYAFICPDMIGGGQYDDLQNPDFEWDQELFVRYAQCSALFPMMQFSTAPWRILDEEHVSYCLDAVKLHDEMAPLINDLAQHAAKTGEPIVRHMAYEFTEPAFSQIKDQFMLGDKLLVAPVLEKGARKRTIVFPAGTWIGDDGSEVSGPCQTEVDVSLTRLPYYKKMV
ncbi:Alpha-xylosidase [Paraliobacillus sp. PM-2]|uniref:glycoside hydrolase family 31 protein n=1 Tax=Paraliobacillus sp. PM-2 TaxID=1462524 RepID=UPI00061BAD10|nr:glycoside hydrolase family 31 protein [Paraliobacillus sp. PM-2]CQR46460.1 Alpha-xylosidase [Paraliobacillus sp. PM-2]